jgi:hypothetical protein
MRKVLWMILFFSTSLSFAQDKVTEEKSDFKELKEILKKDELLENFTKKQKAKKVKKAVKKMLAVQDEFFPDKKSFWEIYPEYWVAKNAAILKWNFERVDMGVSLHTQKILNQVGILEKNLKVLFLNSSFIPHLSFSNTENQFLILISLPFIKAMDLTKNQISLLIIEEVLRAQRLHLEQVLIEKDQKVMYQKKIAKLEEVTSFINQLDEKFMKFLKSQGFSFQMLYEVTLEMKNILASHPILLKDYKELCEKKKSLVINSKDFKFYSRLYPSPEMQLKWLSL